MEQEHKEESRAEAEGVLVSESRSRNNQLEIWGNRAVKFSTLNHGIRGCTLLEPRGWESRLKKVACNPALGL